MNTTFDELTAAAMALPVEAKAELLDRVAASIAAGVEPKVRQLQLGEVRRRRAEVLSGSVQGVSSKQVRDEIGALLK
jgi:hypothetical protein